MPEYALSMRTGPTPGKSYPISGEMVTIGREPGNSIVINDAEISRRHARMTFQGGFYILEDLGSTNGTFVNGLKLSAPHPLHGGEVVSFGEQISCVFEITQEVDPDATMISSAAKPVVPQAVPVAPQPVQAVAEPVSAPVSSYAGRVPVGPEPVVEEPAPPKKGLGSAKIALIVIAIVILCIFCFCLGVFWFIDANNMWCNFLPFLFGSACP